MLSKLKHILGFLLLFLFITGVCFCIVIIAFTPDNPFLHIIGLGIPGLGFGFVLASVKGQKPISLILLFATIIALITGFFWLILDSVLLPLVNDNGFNWGFALFFFSIGGIAAFLTSLFYRLVLKGTVIHPLLLVLAGGLSLFIPIFIIEKSLDGQYSYIGLDTLWLVFMIYWQVSVGVVFCLSAKMDQVDLGSFDQLIDKIGKE